MFVHMRSHVRVLFIGMFILVTLPLSESGAQTSGPDSGALLLAGGAVRSSEIFSRFLELAGGSDALIVVIPTAGGATDYDQECECAKPFRDLGAGNVTILHTYDRSRADSEDFVRPLREAGGVWFSGGRQWRLVDAYDDTLVEEELWGVLERGGIIGGSSAGATIQGSYLARGDTGTNTIMMGDHQVGFGFLKNAAVDQHVLRRNRHYDVLEIVQAHPDLLGIGLDEDTAIVVTGNTFEVIGSSYVLISDYSRPLDSGAPFYFLAPGDVFDLSTRLPVGERGVRGLLQRLGVESGDR